MSDSIKIDDLMKEFSEVFDEQLRSMPGEEFHIEWCAPIVVTPKKGSSKIRLCVDLPKLNKFVTRLHKSRSSRSELEIDLSNFV